MFFFLPFRGMKQKDGPWLFPGVVKKTIHVNEASHKINTEMMYKLRPSSDEINLKWFTISESVFCVSLSLRALF